ncbi:hypothetical protein DPMN_179391 [Dreissena polymorpha]|uniref:Uncharacterized protein n=1 Tax=Dreissena polymorpha TaxID=45954 RepID=A0A9D4EFZ8_DREPO|nr:hypothetical protein DPMN_179391 [Dreissena polymorpha]
MVAHLVCCMSKNFFHCSTSLRARRKSEFRHLICDVIVVIMWNEILTIRAQSGRLGHMAVTAGSSPRDA